MRELLLNYCKYNLWANKQIIQMLSQLHDEQLEENLGGSFGTIRDTIIHIWKAESIWMHRLLLTERSNYPNPSFTGEFKMACDEWQQVSQSFVAFCEKQFDERGFQHEIIYHTLKNEIYKNCVWECIHHCMNHSTFHRGQIINYLRMLGISKIPSTDLISFQRLKK